MYNYNKITVMEIREDAIPNRIRRFDPKSSIRKAKARKKKRTEWEIKVPTGAYVWATKMDRINIIRRGLPYEAIEVISKRANMPVKQILNLLKVPQTTYNKKKKDKDLLSGRDSEVILILTELFDFGISVFNNEEEKFQRWLEKPNISLGGVAPESLFDSLTGIQEVSNCLNRLEYGNMA